MTDILKQQEKQYQKRKKQFEKKDKELFEEVRKLQKEKADDSGNFNRVYELSEKYIKKIIRDIVKDEHATEDIMQETYLQIYNKIGTLKEPEAFYVWAGRIATNLTLRYIQKNCREVLAESDENGSTDFVFEAVSEDNENFIPEAILMDLEKQRIIAEILDGLSIEQKLCVQYFYYEEMSVKEIAQAFGCSEGTIKSRLNYARKSIKDAVIEMDVKHGTRLYSLATMPLLLIVFRNVLEGAVVLGIGGGAVTGAIGKGIRAASDGLSEVTGGNPVVQTPVQEPVVQPPVTPSKATGSLASKIMGTTAGKAAIGVAAAAVVTVSGYGIYQATQAEPDYTNTVAIYYEIPATQLGYENLFDRNYGRFYLYAQIDGDAAAGEESKFSVIYKPDVDPDSRTAEQMDGIDGNVIEKTQYQEFQNVVDYMKNNIDYEFARIFYAENAEKRMNESVPAKERFDDLQFDSETDFYVGRYANVFYSADDIQEIRENWIKTDNMFPQTQEIFIDGQEFTFTTEGSYADISSIYEKYREDAYAEVRAAADACSNPVVNRDIYEDGIIYANSVIVCVYGHIDGDVDLSDSKYVQYKGEDGNWHYYTDRWANVSVHKEKKEAENLSEETTPEESIASNTVMETGLSDETKAALVNLAKGMKDLVDNECRFAGVPIAALNGDVLRRWIYDNGKKRDTFIVDNVEYGTYDSESWEAQIAGGFINVDSIAYVPGTRIHEYEAGIIRNRTTGVVEVISLDINVPMEKYSFSTGSIYDFLMQYGDIDWDGFMEWDSKSANQQWLSSQLGDELDGHIQVKCTTNSGVCTYEIFYRESNGREILLENNPVSIPSACSWELLIGFN